MSDAWLDDVFKVGVRIVKDGGSAARGGWHQEKVEIDRDFIVGRLDSARRLPDWQPGLGIQFARVTAILMTRYDHVHPHDPIGGCAGDIDPTATKQFCRQLDFRDGPWRRALGSGVMDRLWFVVAKDASRRERDPSGRHGLRRGQASGGEEYAHDEREKLDGHP